MVKSVYSGKDGCCCCGCAGKYSYAEKFRIESSKKRGYEVTDDEINDKTVAMIVAKMNKSGEIEKLSDTQFTAVIGKRLYMAML